MIRLLEAAMDERSTVRLLETVIRWGRGRSISAPTTSELALFETET